ncbi:MAG: flagellar motor component [Candidatus Aminicenantes bacterium]|nr:flagellar motor component [Candidatus Aminicenantes bacterium]
MVHKMILVGGVMFFLFVSRNVIGETSAIINLKSGVLVLGGTLMSAFLAFSMKTIKELVKSLRALLRNDETDHEGIVRQIVNLARIGRMDGVRALEAEGKKVEHPFVREGIELVVDGYDRFEIRNIMEKEYELHFSRKESQVNMLNTLAKIAPVLGFVGTIIGLIDVLSNMGEVGEIGKGMALALLTTFYGLLFSNFLFLPLAKRCSEYNRAEASLLNIILEGIMDICEQKNSHAISYRLESYLGLGDSESKDDLEASLQSEDHVLQFPLKEVSVGK